MQSGGARRQASQVRSKRSFENQARFADELVVLCAIVHKATWLCKQAVLAQQGLAGGRRTRDTADSALLLAGGPPLATPC